MALQPASGSNADMAEVLRLLRSNLFISIVAAILGTGVLLDGKLYNKTPVSRSIFSLPAPSKITISQQDSIMMIFEKQPDQWLLTEPAIAPLNPERVGVLLDSNQQTSRSYAAADLPLEELFTNPVTVEIDGNSFQLGTIEPVSKQRYVLAKNRVYLQADHIMPMIRSGTSPFLDLSITKAVKRVSIDGAIARDSNAWSSLRALGIVPRKHITTAPVHSIEVMQSNKVNMLFELFIQEGVSILATPDREFGYLLSAKQAHQLGLKKTN